MSAGGTIDPTSITCQWVREQIHSHALGALGRDDADRLEQHLLGCPDCDRTASGLFAFVPLLALSAPSLAPRHSIRTNMLALIRTESTPTVTSPRRQPVEAARIPIGKARSIPSWLTPKHAVVPVLALLLILSALAISSQRKLGSERDRVTELERENAAIALQLSAIRAGVAAFGDNANAYQLTSVNAESGSAGGVILGDPNQSTALLSVWNMSGEDTSYHVMCESERGELLAAGELIVDDQGVGTIQLNLPATFTEYRAVHIVPGSGTGPDLADVPAKDVLQVLLIDPTAVPISED